MHTQSIERWVHDHTFGQDAPKAGERRTLAVIGITAVTMIAEIAAGVLFGSMALLADGLHMGTHASALTISAFAYFYTRRHATDPRFNFGTGKMNSLAAFASAVMLVIFALGMAGESTKRLVSPVEIQFDWAILVAVVGLLVNGVCLLILRGRGHDHPHDHDAHDHRDEPPHEHSHDIRHDHNLWSAYLHVLADALTSVFAILALLAGKYLHHPWLDPFMGVVGAVLVACWSWGLLRSSAHVLLDMQAPDSLRNAIRQAVEADRDNRVSDLHAWAVGPGIHAAEIVVVTSQPDAPDHYREKLATGLGLVHVTVEVQQCPSAPQPQEGSHTGH
jgi:cation diffusion facilitator family transporter